MVPISDNPEKPSRLKVFAPSVLTLLVGALLALFIFFLLQEHNQDQAHLAFQIQAKDSIALIQGELNQSLGALSFVGDYFDTSEFVSRTEFSEFVNRTLDRYPAIHAISWNPLVKYSDLETLITRAHKEGVEGFAVTERNPAGELVPVDHRREYVTVYYIEPIEKNRPALGFDIASNPVRNEAIKSAFESGQTVATGRIKLVQEKGNQFGVLILRPLYAQGADIGTPELRKKYKKGFVVEVLRIGDAIQNALSGSSHENLKMSLYDLSAKPDEQQLYPAGTEYQSNSMSTKTAIENGNNAPVSSDFSFGTRQWRIIVQPPSNKAVSLGEIQAWVILFGLLLISAGFSFYLYRKQLSERLLRNSEEKFRALFEQSGGYCMIFDPNTPDGIPVIMEANEAACLSHGYKREEFVGRPVADIYDDEGKKLVKDRTKLIMTGKPFYAENIHVRKDGSTFPVAVNAKRIEIGFGKPLILTVEYDISDRLKQEEALRQTQKMEAIGTLSGGIAHDFNNILAAIIGYSQLLSARLPNRSKEEGYLDEILGAAFRAKDLVKQILEFSRNDQLPRELVRMHLIAGEALRLLRKTIPSTIEISANISKEGDTVLADPTKIHQVVMNLCTNAWHAMEESGNLEIILETIEIDAGMDILRRVPDLSVGSWVRLTVADNGSGMSAETITKIFEPFFTTKPPGEGTGMGLAVVHGIVKGLDGAIDIHSQLGTGSRIDVYLPFYSGAMVEQKRKIAPGPTGTEKIMVVDDEPALASMFADMLASLGYSVDSFTSSRKALECFSKDIRAYDLVLTDHTMPDMTGATFAEHLLKERPELPIIICSGYSRHMNEKRASDIGVRAFISKPIEIDLLARKVKEALDQV